MNVEFRILLLVALITIGLAFLINALRQKRHTGRTSLRWPNWRRSGVVLTDLLFWLSVFSWVVGSSAWIIGPPSRSHLGPLFSALAGPAQILGGITLYLGVAIILWGFISLGESFRTSIDYDERTLLVTRGVYRYSRNPMAAGLILVGWGTSLLLQTGFSLLVAAGLTLANRLRVRHEETQLRRVLGREFLDYERRVPRFIGLVTTKRRP
jgi:protein-S-isoprenylcysteine O-methyltransferase Ste14